MAVMYYAMNMMNYKDYIAKIEYDEDDRIFIGHLAGIKDIVGFHGTTLDELENAFHEAVATASEMQRKSINQWVFWKKRLMFKAVRLSGIPIQES